MWPRQMGDAFIAARKMRQDAPARRIGQGGERAIEHPGRIFNHLVNYWHGEIDNATKIFNKINNAIA
jgi:hypothetical protein